MQSQTHGRSARGIEGTIVMTRARAFQRSIGSMSFSGSTWAAPFVAFALLGASGCGGTVYTVYAFSAQSKIETAQALGAEKYAPYEYYYAKEHLTKAQEEAATADYGDAINFAEEAEKSAEKAIKLSKSAHEGSGRWCSEPAPVHVLGPRCGASPSLFRPSCAATHARRSPRCVASSRA